MSASQRWSGQRGRASVIIPVALCGVILLLLALNGKEGIWTPQAEQTLLLHSVERSKFEAFVTEPGDIVSSSNVEVRCAVESRGSAGVTIVSLCEEGTEVEKGDLLVQFDDSGFAERIDCSANCGCKRQVGSHSSRKQSLEC